MTVDEAEAKFGATWTEWTEEQEREFVRGMHPDQCGNPLSLKLAVRHFGYLCSKMRAAVEQHHVGKKWLRLKAEGRFNA